MPVPRMLAEGHVSHRHGHDAGIGIELMKDVLDLADPALRHEIAFADQDHIGKLDLVGQQTTDGPAVALVAPLAATGEQFIRQIVVQKLRRIDHGHHGVKASQVGKASSRRIDESECLGDGQRF